jgi:hypothetical protein
MSEQQTHEMVLGTIHPSGAEEWSCPECGRRFVAQWEPQFKRVILVEGQDGVIHKGQAVSQLLEDVSSPSNAEEEELQDVWKELLDRLDFDSEDDNLNKSP